MKRLRMVLLTALILIMIIPLLGCHEWYYEYPIAYGEGVIWKCDNKDIEFQAFFETQSIQYGHYGKGEFTYKGGTEEFQLMFVEDTVSLVYFDGFMFQAYLSGKAEFSENCMSITVSEVEEDELKGPRYNELLGCKLSFYRTEDITNQTATEQAPTASTTTIQP